MTDQTQGCACAHLRVVRATEDLPGGMTRGWWHCESCRMKFWPLAPQEPTPATTWSQFSCCFVTHEGEVYKPTHWCDYAPVPSEPLTLKEPKA